MKKFDAMKRVRSISYVFFKYLKGTNEAQTGYEGCMCFRVDQKKLKLLSHMEHTGKNRLINKVYISEVEGRGRLYFKQLGCASMV